MARQSASSRRRCSRRCSRRSTASPSSPWCRWRGCSTSRRSPALLAGSVP